MLVIECGEEEEEKGGEEEERGGEEEEGGGEGGYICIKLRRLKRKEERDLKSSGGSDE